MIRLLHMADLHPNSKATFAGTLTMDPGTGKNLSLTDFRRSAEFVCLTAVDPKTKADAVVIPGDLFDSVLPTMDEVRVIVELVEELASTIPVLIIPGNHDMGTSGTMATALEPLRMRANVHIMERPGSVLLDFHGQAVRFFGVPYPSRGKLLASVDHAGKSPEEITALINHGLASILRSFALTFESDVLNVLLAHGTVSTATVGEQPRAIANDILLPLSEMERFDYCALGHIHKQQQVGKTAWYCGSLLRQSFGEESEYKGFNLVELDPVTRHGNVKFIENPHARVYGTLTYEDLEFYEANGEVLNPNTVWRIKETMDPDDYHARKPMIERMAASVPFFQIAIDLIEQDRARDAGMSQLLTMEDALFRVLDQSSEDERASLLEKHRVLVGEVDHAR